MPRAETGSSAFQQPSMLVPAALCTIVFALFALSLSIGARNLLRQPVIKILQGDPPKYRHIARMPPRSALTAAVAIMLLLTMGWMNWLIDQNKNEIDRLFPMVNVEGEILRQDITTSPQGSGLVHKRAVDALLETGFVYGADLKMESPWFLLTETGGKQTFIMWEVSLLIEI
jgi:hypothetical protein